MELDTKEGPAVMNDTFIGFIISVGEKWTPSLRHSLLINCKAMVLAGYVASYTVFIYAGLVMSSVTISELTNEIDS